MIRIGISGWRTAGRLPAGHSRRTLRAWSRAEPRQAGLCFCPVRTECLAEALDNQIEWGVWGGMTERERRALIRRRPQGSRRSVMESARVEHGDGIVTS